MMVKDELTLTYANSCTKKHGYIVDIEELVSINGNNISTIDCSLCVFVTIRVVTLKPDIDMVLEGSVCFIFDKGVFIEIEGLLKVLVILESIEERGYSYNEHLDNFAKKEDDDVIYKGKAIRAQIKGVRYNKNAYNCFGTLVD